VFTRIKTLLADLTPGRRIRLGALAAAWLEDEAADTALAKMRQAALTRWYLSKSRKERERCWYEIRRIDAFTRLLRNMIAERKALLEQQRQKDQRTKRQKFAIM